MKQQGKTWIDAKGNPTASKYVPDYERVCERSTQKIITITDDIQQTIEKAKRDIKALCDQVLTHYIVKNGVTKTFSFTSFDKSFKVEVNQSEGQFRFFRATKASPGHKDYEELNLDFTKADAYADAPIINPNQLSLLDQRTDGEVLNDLEVLESGAVHDPSKRIMGRGKLHKGDD